jgi:hypothetical protein
MKALALLPETESEMSSHATHVSACGDVHMKRGACLMYRSRSEPIGEERRAAVNLSKGACEGTAGARGRVRVSKQSNVSINGLRDQ